MKRTVSTTVKGALFAATLAAPILVAGGAKAEPRTHDGFYMQLDTGLGYLSSSVSVDGATSGQDVSFSGVAVPFEALFGGTVGPVVIGGGLLVDYTLSSSQSVGGVSSNLSGTTLWLIAAEAFADIYPDPHGGFHVRPFLGYASLTATCDNCNGNSPGGPIFGAGVGYDFWVGDEWSIGVLGRFAYAPLSYSVTVLNTTVSANYSTIAPALMASFTFH
jgi:hypothetical protein